MEIYETEKRHTRGEKRLKKQRERERKKEVKLMFGQMEKDGWELMEWVKGTEKAAQLGLIRHSSCLHPALRTSLLFPSLLHPALY